MNKSDLPSTISSKKTNKKSFKNFEEYWNLVKTLSEEHRVLLTNSLSLSEQKSLKNSYEKGGWKDVFMRNYCDRQLDSIKKQFNVDLLEVRASVISGNPYLINKQFWIIVNDSFQNFEWEHIAYIFDGMSAQPYDDDYVKLVRSK